MKKLYNKIQNIGLIQIKKFFVNVFCLFIPIKKLRHDIRKAFLTSKYDEIKQQLLKLQKLQNNNYLSLQNHVQSTYLSIYDNILILLNCVQNIFSTLQGNYLVLQDNLRQTQDNLRQTQDNLRQTQDNLQQMQDNLRLMKYNNLVNNQFNINKILSLKNKYKDQDCFIIGSAPSLKKLDLTKLNNSKYKIFICNKGYLLKDLGLKHADFYNTIDPGLFNENKSNIDFSFFDYLFLLGKDTIFEFYDLKNYIYLPEYSNIYNKINKTPNYPNNIYFQTDILQPMCDVGSVIAIQIQIAYYLGFKNIYLIGVDCSFQQETRYFYEISKEEKARLNLSIITQEYFLNFLDYATKFLKEKNVNLLNASPEGIVDCMPRVKYDDLF